MSKLTFDPQQMPVASIAGEPAIDPVLLQPASLRMRFAAPPQWQSEFAAATQSQAAELTAAAVLIPLIVRDNGIQVLLTRRTAHLNHHAGQISFPGGRTETQDGTPVVTALRETEEEIGLDRSHIDVIGTMPDYDLINSSYRVTPIVGLVRQPFAVTADPFEVAEIFEVPLSFLMNGAHHQRRSAFVSGQGHRTFYAIPYQHYFIWGATAAMLRNLFHFLRA